MTLHLHDVTVKRGPCPVVQGVSLTVRPGEFVGLIGPNGAGKTTLMRAALGLMPFSGVSSVADMPPAARARHAAWLPQTREVAWPVSVETLVALGRKSGSDRLTRDDIAAVSKALEMMGLSGYRSRSATELSGGEQARVLIARALAQETALLLADEPAAGLDPANQISLMQVLAGLARDGRAVVASLHDLGLAARHCTRLVVLHNGKLAADGPPATVLTPDLLARVFQITAWFEPTAQGRVFQPLEVLE